MGRKGVPEVVESEVLDLRPPECQFECGTDPVPAGELYRGTGDEAKAQEHLTTAATMYGEMGMGFWLERAAATVR